MTVPPRLDPNIRSSYVKRSPGHTSSLRMFWDSICEGRFHHQRRGSVRASMTKDSCPVAATTAVLRSYRSIITMIGSLAAQHAMYGEGIRVHLLQSWRWRIG